MKAKNYLFVATLLLLAACKKETKVEEVDFQVSAEKLTVSVNEELNFLFKGNPGLITFYSGEPKNAYAYKDVDRIASYSELNMSFGTSIQAVTNTPLAVMFSTDYQEAFTANGEYTYESVLDPAAGWKDITSRFHLATTTYPTYESSGVVNIADLIVKGKPFYIAFKYITPAIPTGTVPTRAWRVNDFRLETISDAGFYERLAYSSVVPAGFKFARREPQYVSLSGTFPAILQFIPPRSTEVGFRLPMEIWAVSKAFASTINMGTDFGISIKNYQTASMSNYKYSYTRPGVYKATFVAANTNIYDSKKVVREIEITVEP